MDILGWVGWVLWKAIGIVWGLAWFLLGGWVSTLAQIAVVALVIFGYKFGWKRAPQEILTRASAFGRYFWGWIRARDYAAGDTRVEVREIFRTIRVKEAGDVNVSTLLTLMMLGGLALLSVA